MKGVIKGVLALSLTVAAANANPNIGEPAPGFSIKDAQGRTRTLAEFKGSYVVLEWVNFGCPFVRKHYDSGNMQHLQQTYTEKGVVWLSVCSSAPGKQGYFDGEDLINRLKKEQSRATAYLVDAEGTTGKLYEARATPTMYVINPAGTLIYAGGIDDIASTDRDDIGKATNYVQQVLDAALAGSPLPVTTSRAYGCSVKYK